VRQYVEASGDVAWLGSATRGGPTVWDTIIQGVAQPLRANLEPSGIAKADSSIWEVHDQNKKHYAYTTLAAIRGFCDLAAVAQKSGHSADVATYAGIAKKARDGFFALFLDKNSAIGGSVEGLAQNQYFDAAVVEAFNWNIIKDSDYQGTIAKATLDLINRLRVDSGGYKRNNDGLSSYDNNEWILIDLRMADALWRAGQTQDSQNTLQTVIQKAAANYYLLPELYNAVPADGAVGKYAGSIPMVGYGAGAYALTVLDRSGLIEPNHCGDNQGNKSSGRAYKCATDGVMPDGGSGESSRPPTAAELPYENACLCQLQPGRSRPGAAVYLALLAVALLLGRRALRGRS
jgi:hypothetical protein